jgi:hypothetical protein
LSKSQFGAFWQTTNQYQLSGNLSWEADILGKIRSNKRAMACYLQTTAVKSSVKTQCTKYRDLLSIAFSRCANKVAGDFNQQG